MIEQTETFGSIALERHRQAVRSPIKRPQFSRRKCRYVNFRVAKCSMSKRGSFIGHNSTDGRIDIPANTSNRLNLIGAAYSPDFKNTVVMANRAVGLDLDERFDHEDALNTFFCSDQFPFVLHNIPAFWFFTGFHPAYHHISDTADKINYPKMLKILQLSYLSGWVFANQLGYSRFVADPPGG